MKLHDLRVTVPSDDKVLLKDVQERLRAMLDDKGMETLPGEGPTEDLAGPVPRMRIHWPAADVLQHGDRPAPRPIVARKRAKKKRAAT